MFGKLINGLLQMAPRKIRYNGCWIYNPPAEILLALGYKPVVYTDPPDPDPGYVLVFNWVETEDQITQHWFQIPEEVED